MNRKKFQALAKTRLQDAKVLLGRKRWSAAYYFAGYVVECGLKACLLRRVAGLNWEELIFTDPKVLKDVIDSKIHDLSRLVRLADLDVELKTALGNKTFAANWQVALSWTVESRYSDSWTEQDARSLYDALTHDPDGVLPWIQSHW